MSDEIGEIINDLEAEITRQKVSIEMFTALERLRRNPDFISIIEKGYLQERAIKLVTYRGSSGCVGPEAERTDLDIIAIGRLAQYFNLIESRADNAIKTIDLSRQQITELERQTDEGND